MSVEAISPPTGPPPDPDLQMGLDLVVDPTLPIIPKSGSVDVNYTCTWATKPSSYSGTNTATATWNKATAFTPNGSASGSKDFEFKNPTEINPVITVDDDKLTGESWSADRAAGEWTYTKPFVCSTNLADYTDGKYGYSLTNTAKINETGQTDTATVDVTCYWPQIDITKSGDELSKKTDKVYYDITVFNNTPTDANLRDLSCTLVCLRPASPAPRRSLRRRRE